VIKKPRGRGHSPRWATEPEKIIITTTMMMMMIIIIYAESKSVNFIQVITNFPSGHRLEE
jgi:hypothetical protein